MRYPFVILLRHDKYQYIDTHFSNKDSLLCTITITNDFKDLNKLFNSDNQIFVTFGDVNEYISDCMSIIAERMRDRWIHYNELPDLNTFNNNVNYCFIHNCSENREKTRPIFSAFSTAYNSYGKILRAYDGLKSQKLKDWEWVIVDDSPDDKNFEFLKENFMNDNRIRLYRRSENSGNIGNVKNEAISLCRGKYLLELDHDDLILPDVFSDATRTFDENPDVGFVYMDFINIHENGDNFWYGNSLCKGYGSYYCQKYNGTWVYVYNTPNINNITLSHLVCCPNHPRIWRKESLIKAGNYSEFLPICDDYEILLRTAVTTKMAKINKLGYIQYMNSNGNNFSWIRNAEINRIGPQYIYPIFYEKYSIHDVMRKQKAYESEEYLNNHIKIWHKGLDKKYVHKYANLLINYDYDKQYCILGLETLIKNLPKIQEIYKNKRNDILLLDTEYDNDFLFNKLVENNLDNIKFFNLEEKYDSEDKTKNMMKNYFLLRYKSVKDHEFIE